MPGGGGKAGMTNQQVSELSRSFGKGQLSMRELTSGGRRR